MKKTKFINQKICAKNGFSTSLSSKDFIQKNKKYYQEIEDYDWIQAADQFSGLEAILHRLRERQTLRLIKSLKAKKTFIDVGCGAGLILRHLPPYSVGLDINPRNISRAKKYAPRAKLVCGDIEKIPFPKQSFKTVICTDVLEHLPKTDEALREIFRVLEKGGILIGSVPAQNPVWKLRFLSSTHPGEPYHRLYEEKEVKKLFGGRGKILKIQKKCLGMNFFFIVKND